MQLLNNDKRMNRLVPILLAVLIILFFSRILFTDKIIRASDVITQFFWSAKDIKSQSIMDYLTGLPQIFQAQWEPLNDGGRTLEGGWNAIGLLFHRYLIQHLLPFPTSIAWLAVLSLAWGGIGSYCYCRLIGIGRLGSFAAGLLFALATENASLINAGHIQKIEAIAWAPWVLFFLEKGVRERRLFPYAMTALMLAIQFFHMHWQISFYTCLTVGGYWLFMMGRELVQEGRGSVLQVRRQVLLAVVMTLLFFSTIAMSFAPLLSWSKQSERGGGMSYSEAMSWSMPPEEVLTYVVPGLFGLSRQEAGDVPMAGQAYYWGRMTFTQTNDYMGLLPWLLLPLPLFFRRDKYTVFFATLMVVTLLMAMGKYTLFYEVVFKYIPGFSSFRVPKMILFLFAFSAAVIMGQGIDMLRNNLLDDRQQKRWLTGVTIVTGCIGLGLLLLFVARGSVLSLVQEMIALPTRYQSGASLVVDRYLNMVSEMATALTFVALYLSVFLLAFRRKLSAPVFFLCLLVLFVGDLWRVNSRFLVVADPPLADRKAARSAVVRFLEKNIDHYRMQPLGDQDALYYADYGLPNISAYVTVSEKRYREFIEGFNFLSGMPDMMNLKYLVMSQQEYEQQKAALGEKYALVFSSPESGVVVENRTVLPKAWLVSSVMVVDDVRKKLEIMNSSPSFQPAQVALVESAPSIPMTPAGQVNSPGTSAVEIYEPNRIVVRTETSANALLVLGEKYYRWWFATVDGSRTPIYPVNHILRGVYLRPGIHRVEFVFDPLPFKIGKYLTLASLAFMVLLLVRELGQRKNRRAE